MLRLTPCPKAKTQDLLKACRKSLLNSKDLSCIQSSPDLERKRKIQIKIYTKQQELERCSYLLFCVCFRALTCFLQRHCSAKNSVPVTKERSKVAAGPLVVHVVSRSAAQQPERHQVVEGPRQVVADVVLHRHPDAENRDAPRAQRVALEQNGVLVAPEANSHEFGDAEVLRGPGERRHVLVVDGVDPPVELRVLVMDEMPDVVLGVEDEKNRQSLGEHLIQRRGVLGQRRRRQDEHADDHGGQNKEDVVVRGRHEAPRHHGHRGPPVWLDLVLMQQGHSFPQEVQNGEWQAEKEVAGEGEQDGEEGRRDERHVVKKQVIPERLQQGLGGPGRKELRRQLADVEHLDGALLEAPVGSSTPKGCVFIVDLS